jgi:NhaP-type Na+/H+ or K+/H+ antiporter
MAFTIERIKTYRRWLGWGFVGSCLVLAILLASALMPDAPSGYRLPDDNRMYPPLDAQKVLVLGFFVISFTTLIGFVVTTVVTRWKERRDSNHASIEMEKKQPELEKLRREIADKNAAAQEKRKKVGKRRRVV